MNHYKNALKMTALGLALAAGQALAHGNVTPVLPSLEPDDDKERRYSDEGA